MTSFLKIAAKLGRWAAAVYLVSAMAAVAQERPVALIADKIEYSEETGEVRAAGDVQVFFGDRTLTADEIVYDDVEGRIRAVGSVTLRTGDGETVYADAADLDKELRDGMIEGARSIIADGGASIAALEAERVDNRYNVLRKAVFSPCEVCAERPVPLWRIRAERIIHDQEARRVHYDDAYFDLFGVPVAYLPYFRHPSPEVERATGFLPPTAGRDSAYGVFAKAPFYYVIDDFSDATLTPFVSLDDGGILETEYRRRFERGFVELDLNFGVTDYGDDGEGARARLGGFGTARYGFEGGVLGGIDLAFAADDPFLRRYDYTSLDRITTQGFLRAYEGRSFFDVGASYVQSFRAGEPQSDQPIALPEASARYVLDTPFAGGGELGLTLGALGLTRTDGRDVARFSAGADWSRDAILENGLVLRGFAEAKADYYRIADDAAFDDSAARLTPRAGAEARMPFSRAGFGGSVHVVEPIVQFVVSPEDLDSGDIPNEDSITVEFDEMNLFETDRFAGEDRYEGGAFMNIGARYQLIDPSGLGLTASGGRVFRFTDAEAFSDAAGLNGDTSDYVASIGMTYQSWADARARFRFTEDFGIERADIGGRIAYDPFTLYGYYLFVEADPAEESLLERSEIFLGGSVDFTRNWRASGEARRDLELGRFDRISAAIGYEDECAGFEFYATRRLSAADEVPDSFSFGVRARLFGAGGDRSKASGSCDYLGAN